MFHQLPTALAALALSVLPALADDLNSPLAYAPQTGIACPDTSKQPLVRVFTPQTQALHPDEAAYVSARQQNVIPGAWKSWVGDGHTLGYDIDSWGANYSKIGIAISGGGYRAAQYGAGVLSALDARNSSAASAGTGGLMQVASYVSALSGGSWLTGSLFLNNWPTIKDLVYGDGNELSGWILDLDLAAPGGDDPFSSSNQAFYGSILWSVYAKANLGLDTSLTDPWARMISYHFLNQTNRDNFFTNNSAHGAGQLWSEIPNSLIWQNHSAPFPLICADSRPAGSNITTALDPASVVYEITPIEFGSWDPNLSAMVNLTYAGTHLSNGQPDNSTSCVTGFDEAGFVMGTSASLFNQIFDRASNILQGFGLDGNALIYVLERQLRTVRTRADDVANWPNPFRNLKNNTFQDANSTWLELIDGSSNEENVPLGAMFVKARGLDVVVAIDASADDPVNRWPNGSSIIFSASRMQNILEASHQAFPPIPASTDQFISTGTNARPTFFGCDPVDSPPLYPLVIYFPNSPPLTGAIPVTNTGTFKISYVPLHTELFIDQVHNNTLGGFVPNSNSPDPNFGLCLQCAAVDRARLRAKGPPARSQVCQTCFTQYCFDPANPPSKDVLTGRNLVFVDPAPEGLTKVTTFLGRNKNKLIGGFVALFVAICAVIGFLIWRNKRRTRVIAYHGVNQLHEGDHVPAYEGVPSMGKFGHQPSTSGYELPDYKK